MIFFPKNDKNIQRLSYQCPWYPTSIGKSPNCLDAGFKGDQWNPWLTSQNSARTGIFRSGQVTNLEQLTVVWPSNPVRPTRKLSEMTALAGFCHSITRFFTLRCQLRNAFLSEFRGSKISWPVWMGSKSVDWSWKCVRPTRNHPIETALKGFYTDVAQLFTLRCQLRNAWPAMNSVTSAHEQHQLSSICRSATQPSNGTTR